MFCKTSAKMEPVFFLRHNMYSMYSIRPQNWPVGRKRLKKSLFDSIVLCLMLSFIAGVFWHSTASWNQEPQVNANIYSQSGVKTASETNHRSGYNLVNTGLIEMKSSGFLPEIHSYHKNLRILCWYNWGGCNSHIYTGQCSSRNLPWWSENWKLPPPLTPEIWGGVFELRGVESN